MVCSAKNIDNCFVVANILHIFALPNVHYSSDRVHICEFRNIAGLSCGAIPANSGRLATITGEARLFFTRKYKLSDQCQTSQKVAIPRRIVTGLHSHRFCKSLQKLNCSKSLPKTSSNRWKTSTYTVARCRPSGVGAMPSSRIVSIRSKRS